MTPPQAKKKKYRMAKPPRVDDDAATDTWAVRMGADPEYVLDSAEQAEQRKRVNKQLSSGRAWRNSTDSYGGWPKK